MELPNQLITIAQAAEEFGVNPKTLETWRHRGEITRIGTAPKDGARPGRRAGLYDRAQIEAALACRARKSQRPSHGAQPVSPNLTSAPRASSHRPTTRPEAGPAGASRPNLAFSELYRALESRGPRAISTRVQLAHQLTSQRCALKGCDARLNALTVKHRDEYCSVECAKADHDAGQRSTESTSNWYRR